LRKRRFSVVSLDDDLRSEVILAYGRALRDDCVAVVIRDGRIERAFTRSSLGETDFTPPYRDPMYDQVPPGRYRRVWSFLQDAFNALEEPLRREVDNVE
jgi:hypothetical protein